jgi:methyl coenzyme M reductase subunit C
VLLYDDDCMTGAHGLQCSQVENSVVAGANTVGSANGVGTLASFNTPSFLAVSSDGSYALITDSLNHKIRKMVMSTSAVSTFAGSGSSGAANGVGTAASFSQPMGVAMSSDGTFAVTSCKASHRIRRIEISTAVVTTLAGSGVAGLTNGVGTNPSFNTPYGVAMSSDSSFALVCDFGSKQIRKIVLSTRMVSTLAGSSAAYTNGIGTNAAFSGPVSLSVSSNDTVVYISEQTGRVRKLVLSTLAVTLLAGGSTGSTGPVDGIGSLASFNSPQGILLTSDDMSLYVSDFSNNKIRRIVVSTQRVSTLLMASSIPAFSAPYGLAWLSNDDSVLLVSVQSSSSRGIREVYGTCPAPTIAPTVAPTSMPSAAASAEPTAAPTGSPSMAPTPRSTSSGEPHEKNVHFLFFCDKVFNFNYACCCMMMIV